MITRSLVFANFFLNSLLNIDVNERTHLVHVSVEIRDRIYLRWMIPQGVTSSDKVLTSSWRLGGCGAAGSGENTSLKEEIEVKHANCYAKCNAPAEIRLHSLVGLSRYGSWGITIEG